MKMLKTLMCAALFCSLSLFANAEDQAKATENKAEVKKVETTEPAAKPTENAVAVGEVKATETKAPAQAESTANTATTEKQATGEKAVKPAAASLLCDPKNPGQCKAGEKAIMAGAGKIAGTDTATPGVQLAKNYHISPNPVLLGKIPFDTKQNFVLRVLNSGKEPLTIKGVRPSCACLVAESFTKEPIKPGEFGEIKAVLTADKKEGDTRKLFYIQTSDKDDVIAEVIINCSFVPAEGGKLVLSGDQLEFGTVSAKDGKRLAVVRLMNFGDVPLKITQIIGERKGVTLKLDSDEPFAPHQGVTLRAWVDPKESGNGDLATEIILMTDSPLTPAATVKITGKVE